MEEEELDEILRSTIADPLSKAYRHMLTALFSQNVNAADDLLFDSEIYKVREFRGSKLNCESILFTLCINVIAQNVSQMKVEMICLRKNVFLKHQTIYELPHNHLHLDCDI